jgi:hypothetical protein
MKTWAWGAIVVSMVGVMSAGACAPKSHIIDLTGVGGSGNGGSSSHVTASHGSGVTTGTGGATGCGTFQFSTDPTCETCIEGACCAELAACDTGTPCNDLFNCLGACASGDMACQMACTTAQSAGVSDAQALVNCYDNNCKTDMACSTGEICSSGVSTPVQACSDCDTANCCAEWTACGMDPTCASCLVANPAASCKTNVLLNAAQSCQDTKCPICNAGKICDSGLIDPGNAACGDCDGQKCCAEFDACVADAMCLGCITGQTTTGCSTNTKVMAVDTCQKNNCTPPCQ